MHLRVRPEAVADGLRPVGSDALDHVQRHGLEQLVARVVLQRRIAPQEVRHFLHSKMLDP